ncbi:MAG TPA: DNA methyltransferase, partial [Beutenbergiaceae bacterium]|nr:DNA methyltransferase [Beutenbergiaceae bacterium]
MGEHYTSDANILKTIGPLFLDELKREFRRGRADATVLRNLRQRIRDTRLLDPACGGGNFLVVAYQQLHQLDRQIVQRLRSLSHTTSGNHSPAMQVHQCGGVEINLWPAQVAAAALQVAHHQANRAWELAFGTAHDSSPLPVKTIVVGNALRLCWSQVFPPSPDVVVVGNPPFVGQYTKSPEQTADLRHVWGGAYSGYLDYVSGWFAKAAEYFTGASGGRFGFVATNSIAHGRAVPDLFGPLFSAGWRLRFAHQTFAWTSETNHEAGVHCVVVGFDRHETSSPRLFTYPHPKADPVEAQVTNINAYLVEGPNLFITPRTTPLSPQLPQVTKGSQPTDQGHLLLDSDDYERVVNDPRVGKYVRIFIGAKELIHNRHRWCLWLEDLDAADLEASAFLQQRLEAVREFREGSAKSATRNAASTPHLFTERRQPRLPYVCIPSHFSETRPFPTVSLFEPGVIAGNANFTAADSDGYLFGIVSSSMFLAWQKTVGGRLESRLRFSNTIVWNNLPLPQTSARLRQRIIQAGHRVIDARGASPELSLAQLYEPSSMTPKLIRAHTALDHVVDQAFGATKPLSNDAERQALLFHQYERLMSKSNV